MDDKCSFCNKKKLIIFKCKCGLCFCQKHYIPEKHNCTFDYKTEQKIKILKDNPNIGSFKMESV